MLCLSIKHKSVCFVLSLQVSMTVGSEISSEMAKSQAPQPPPSAGAKERKDEGKGKKVKEVSSIAQIILELYLFSSF